MPRILAALTWSRSPSSGLARQRFNLSAKPKLASRLLSLSSFIFVVDVSAESTLRSTFIDHMAATLQQESFGQRVKIELIRRGKDVNWLAARLGRLQTSVSTAINHPTEFPALKKQIARV